MKKPIIILVSALVLAGGSMGAFLAAKHKKDTEASLSQSQQEDNILFSFSSDNVTKLEFDIEDGEYVAEKDENSVWSLSNRDDFALDQVLCLVTCHITRQCVEVFRDNEIVLASCVEVDVRELNGASAVLEAWYSGEQGGRAIADVLTGKRNPGGRLPMSWVKSVGQNPYYYSIKPSGRGYGYVENDVEYSDFQIPESLGKDEPLKVRVKVTNTGEVEGDEVVQVYVHDEIASVARPLKELVAFKRVTLSPGESKDVEIEVPYRRFGLWDKNLRLGVEEGWFEVWLGKNAEEKVVSGGRVFVK